MFLTRSEYDRGVNTFSPEGRLYQIEYANEAIKLGSTTIGICTVEGIVMAVEKRITSSLLEPGKIEKIVEIDKHIGCATSGLIADARTLLDRARVECQNHWFLYDEPMPVESCAQAVSNLAFQFGDSDEAGAMSRPFGVALLFAGIHKNLPELWYMDPSGTYVKHKAKAIGSGSESAEEDLRAYIKSKDIDLTLSEAVTVALTTLKRIMEDTLTSQNVEIMKITPKTETDDGGFKMLTKEDIEAEILKLA